VFVTGIASRGSPSSDACGVGRADRDETRPPGIEDSDNCHDHHPVHGAAQATGAIVAVLVIISWLVSWTVLGAWRRMTTRDV
jgi:hypothetical protein